MFHVNLNTRLNCHWCWTGRGSHNYRSSQIFLSVSISLSSSPSNIFTAFLLSVPHSHKWVPCSWENTSDNSYGLLLIFSSFKEYITISFYGILWVTSRTTQGRQGAHPYSFVSVYQTFQCTMEKSGHNSMCM